ncbi:MAG: tyrosine-type recombinase/integrase [Prevotella sp.]
MTTIKLKFRPSAGGKAEGTLYYRVVCRRRVTTISTTYHIRPDEWDHRREAIITLTSSDNNDPHGALLRLYRAKTDWEMEQMRQTATIREQSADGCTFEQLTDALRAIPPCPSVFGFIRAQIDKKTRMQCYGTAKTYTNALRSFRRFRGGIDLTFHEMDARMMEAYETWMLHGGLRLSSAACYMRTLRTLYRMAEDEDVARDDGIFRKVHLSVGKTRRRAVTTDVIRAIQALDLSRRPSLSFARDIFMFSFYTRGMSFVDIAYLKKSDLKDGLLTYHRRKTFQCLTLEWEQPMQAIVSRYAQQTDGSSYMFPIVSGESAADRAAYEQTLQRTNRNLRRIGRMIGLTVPLTTYVARHSWASIARDMNIPLPLISEGLGHDSDKTTQVYLASLDTSRINSANKMIIKRITHT